MMVYRISAAQIDEAVERYWDRRWEELNAPDAWETDEPDWTDVLQVLENGNVANTVRGFIEDMDDLLPLYETLGEYAQPIKGKDPDEAVAEADRVLTAFWNDDTLMETIWKNLPDDLLKKLVETEMEHADRNGLREKYNKWREQ